VLRGGPAGHLLRDARAWERIVLIVAAILLIKPGYMSDIAGLVLLGIVAFAQKVKLPVPPAGTAAERAK
jgi:TRAP-type uncharacterized transport system, fused permease components